MLVCARIGPVLAHMYIYNASLAQGSVPDDWRLANGVPIYKRGEKYDPQIIDPCRSHAYVARRWSI